MKKLTLNLLVAGALLTAFETSSYAAESAKFEQLKAQYESGKLEVVPPSPDVKDFLDTSNTEIQSLQTKLSALLKEKGYLVGTEYAEAAQTFLSDSKTKIKSLRGIQNLPSEIALARAQVPLLLELLDNMSPPDQFPFKCFNYKGTAVEGIVDSFMGKLVFRYGAEEKDFHTFIDPITDVGLIGSGKEVTVSPTPNGQKEKALLDENGRAACLSLPYPAK